MRQYWAVTKGNFMAFSVRRVGFFFTLLGNLVYIAVVYFLWRSIFKSQPTLRGMTFEQAFMYLTLAGSLFILFKTYTDWYISNKIVDGSLIVDLIRPLDFQLFTLFGAAGMLLVNLVLVTLPSFLLVIFVFKASIAVGPQLLLFPAALLLAFLLSFSIDYIVGLAAFYTESLWGISATKEVVVSMLSGALVPIQFFPDGARQALELLPFQAIYHTPLVLVTTPDLPLATGAWLLAKQLAWLAILFGLSRALYNRALKKLTVNGG